MFIYLVGREGAKSPAEEVSLPWRIGNLGERMLDDLMDEEAKKLGLQAWGPLKTGVDGGKLDLTCLRRRVREAKEASLSVPSSKDAGGGEALA